ncbi:hypothetical protein [Christiangramia sp.]|uniref:hypothetical protein n=1 Tax=Christiangramia sp. TaxID=1931228 RepID=UPI0026045631|nr:hypothetical protein [Christiangramia sp.]
MKNGHLKKKSMKTCARCKGKFPGPGIKKNEKVYCCDKCARGRKKMMFKVIPAALGIFGSGFLIGLFTKTKLR